MGMEGVVGRVGARARARSVRMARALRRHPWRSGLGLVVLVLVGLGAFAVTWVQLAGRGRTYDVADVPAAPVALVLGAGVKADGTPSDYLAARLGTAAELYGAGKVRVVLVSGDHGREEYDEVASMTAWLVDHGVPAEKVVADHAGFDTYDSCERATRIFGVDEAIVVTQAFHLPRALFLCRQAGIRAVGVEAATPGGRPAVNRTREVPASLKAAWDALSDPGPRYLGDHEDGVDDALAEG